MLNFVRIIVLMCFAREITLHNSDERFRAIMALLLQLCLAQRFVSLFVKMISDYAHSFNGVKIPEFQWIMKIKHIC